MNEIRQEAPPGAASGSQSVPRDHATAVRRRYWRIAATLCSILILALSAYIVTRTLLTIDYHELRLAFQATELEQILAALALTAVSYLALTGYDALALRQLRIKIAYRITALASFTSYAISFTMGFPLITGGTVRYWIYSQSGLGASHVASLTLIAGITFWLGMAVVIGVLLVAIPAQIAELNQLKVWVNRAIGAGILGCAVTYLVWVSRSPRRLSVKGAYVELPGYRLSLGQIGLGAVDLVFAAGALFVLLPKGHGLDFPTFVAIYVFACLLGIASNAPGGIGAFEATILKIVPAPSTEALFASLLLFRIIYYFLPFVLAFALLGAHEGMRRWKGLRAEMHEDPEGGGRKP
ncbi:MAG: UPF0104 family protein [Alphaproteobacteria bacterium]|nr:UPF0104 family protein [Alphaproteobacteria bacterium]